MQFELNFFQPVGDVFVVYAFDEDAPFVGMVFGRVGRAVVGVEWLGFAAED